MASDSSTDNAKPRSLSSAEIDKILSMTLIANLATLGENNSIHIVPMWFIRIGNDICIPTSRHSQIQEPQNNTTRVSDDRYFPRGSRLERGID